MTGNFLLLIGPPFCGQPFAFLEVVLLPPPSKSGTAIPSILRPEREREKGGKEEALPSFYGTAT